MYRTNQIVNDRKIFIGRMSDFKYIKVEVTPAGWFKATYCSFYAEAVNSLFEVIHADIISIDQFGIHTPLGVYEIILNATIYEIL